MYTAIVMTAAAAAAITTTKFKQPDGKWSSSLLECFSTQYEKYYLCQHNHIPSLITANIGAKFMIYTIVIIDHPARAGKLYMGESETIWNKF